MRSGTSAVSTFSRALKVGIRLKVWKMNLCVPITSSTSCHQAIFVDQATDLSPSSDAVQVEVNRLG